MATESTSGFIYIWYDRKHKRYYVGCHWGPEDDGYISSSVWLRNSYKRRPQDFKRRIISRITTNRADLLEEEFRWLSMIKDEELKVRYYNLQKHHFGHWTANPNSRSIREKISEKVKEANTRPEVREKMEKVWESNKGKPAWNKGKTMKDDPRIPSSWNKGIKLEDSQIMQISAEKISNTLKERHKNGELSTWSKGKTMEDDPRIKSTAGRTFKHSEENNQAKSERQRGNPNFKRMNNSFAKGCSHSRDSIHNRKPIHTPFGEFDSIAEAERQLKHTQKWFYLRLRKNPDEYYYIVEKH